MREREIALLRMRTHRLTGAPFVAPADVVVEVVVERYQRFVAPPPVPPPAGKSSRKVRGG